MCYATAPASCNAPRLTPSVVRSFAGLAPADRAPPSCPLAGSRVTRRLSALTGYRLFADSKALYPLHIALVRIGDYYEAIGSDAVLVAEHVPGESGFGLFIGF